ncbi:MAG: hypothetical protein ABIG42_06255 [bacterium]
MKFSIDEIAVKRTRNRAGQKSTKTKIHLRRLIRRLFLSLILVAFFWYLNYGSLFIVRSVEITAAEPLSVEKIRNDFQTSDLLGLNFLYLPYFKIAQCFESCPQIESVSFTFWRPGELKIYCKPAQPYIAMAKPFGYYILGQNGQFIGIQPPQANVKLPVKLSNENVLFNNSSKPLRAPWQETLLSSELDDSKLMLALGYRDLLNLRELILSQPGFPSVEYVGYDERYGLVLKCHNKPLILIGYGTNLELQFDKARKVLIYPALQYNEDKYIDLRFDKYQSVKALDSIDLF